MPVIMACPDHSRDADLNKPRFTGVTRRSDEFASGWRTRASSSAMMGKRVVAAVIIGALVLAGGGVLGSLFF
jgi:hypothetical protein